MFSTDIMCAILMLPLNRQAVCSSKIPFNFPLQNTASYPRRPNSIFNTVCHPESEAPLFLLKVMTTARVHNTPCV
jgi:hypothetical protein